MYNNLTDLDLSNIQPQDKITVIKQSDFGYPIAIQLKVDKVFFYDYAQYRNCIAIQGKPPRKRKLRRYLLKPNEEFIIYKGFVEVKDTTKVISKNDKVTVSTLGMCFDKNTLINSLPDAEIIFSTLN